MRVVHAPCGPFANASELGAFKVVDQAFRRVEGPEAACVLTNLAHPNPHGQADGNRLHRAGQRPRVGAVLPPASPESTVYDRHRPGIPRLPLPGRGDPLGGALVPAVSDQLPRPRTDARRQGRGGRSHNHVPLGPALRPGSWRSGCAATCVLAAGRGTSTSLHPGQRQWRYLTGPVDGTGQTIDFLLSAKRDKKAAKRFFKQALARSTPATRARS